MHQPIVEPALQLSATTNRNPGVRGKVHNKVHCGCFELGSREFGGIRHAPQNCHFQLSPMLRTNMSTNDSIRGSLIVWKRPKDISRLENNHRSVVRPERRCQETWQSGDLVALGTRPDSLFSDPSAHYLESLSVL